MSWSTKLYEYDIQYIIRLRNKSRVLVDFVIEFSFPAGKKIPHIWIIFVHNASSLKWGARIVIEGPGDFLIEHSLKIEFKANKKSAKYEALIVNMVLSLEIGTSSFKARSDSHLVVN